MSEPARKRSSDRGLTTDGALSTGRTYWQAIGPREAVQWIETDNADGTTSTVGPEALVMFRPVEFAALRSVPLANLQPHVVGYPEFQQDEPPTPLDIAAAWQATARTRAVATRRSESKLGAFKKRGTNESVSAFYERVGEFYRHAMRVSDSPVQLLALSAKVRHSTASRWVREARARGYLPPTTRGRRRA